MRPAYGLAEGTLIVAGTVPRELPRMLLVDSDALGHGRIHAPTPTKEALTLVSSGIARGAQRIAIVDPLRRTALPPFRRGETWASGPNVANGYWNRAGMTQDMFGARTTTGEGPFLRTGDLGFLSDDGELFIAGRLKDVINIRGRNLHAQDVERAAERCLSVRR